MTEAPRSGGRVLLELAAATGDRARYAVTLVTASGRWEGETELTAGAGPVRIEGVAGAPGWLVGAAEAFSKVVAAKRRGESPPRWPRRLHRWRAPAGT